MNPITRFFRYLKALFTSGLDKLENPEIILNQAVEEMKAAQIKNRELAVQALTQKNNLQNMVDQEEKKSKMLEAKAALALQNGNRELARQLLREKGSADAALVSLKESLKSAEASAEAVKRAIRKQEDDIRTKTAEALSLKARMKQSQIQIEINKALDGFQLDTNTQSFDRAKEKIQSMQSESDARAEIAATSMNSRLMELDDMVVDAETEKALLELEAKIGQGGAATNGVAQTTIKQAGHAEDDIEKQLRELEQKLSQG